MPPPDTVTVCVPAPLKKTARPLGVNVPARVQLPPTLRSPPFAVERRSVPLLITFFDTVMAAVIAFVPAISKVELVSIVNVPAICRAIPVPLFAPMSSVVLLLTCTLFGKPAPDVALHSEPRPYVPPALYLSNDELP